MSRLTMDIMDVLRHGCAGLHCNLAVTPLNFLGPQLSVSIVLFICALVFVRQGLM